MKTTGSSPETTTVPATIDLTKPIVMRNGAPAPGEEHLYQPVSTYRGYTIYERLDDGKSNSNTDS